MENCLKYIIGLKPRENRYSAPCILASIIKLKRCKLPAKMRVKGSGEPGMVGIPAAIANAVFHATGKRIGELPVTPDKIS